MIRGNSAKEKAMKVHLAVRLGIAIAAIFAAGAAVAQGPGMGPGGMGPGRGPGFGDHRPPMERAMRADRGQWWNNPNVAEKLKLTDEQRKAMDVIFQQHREKLVDLRGNVEKAEIAMDPLVKADQPNESAVLAQIDKVAQARAELEKANARFLFQLRAKLTPEQWKQVQEFRQNRPGMHREWRNGDHGPGGERGRPGDDKDKGAPPPPPPGAQGMLDGDGPAENFPAPRVNL
jgi:periplasmic protein CpxP/Spy